MTTSINTILVELEVAMRSRKQVEMMNSFRGVPVLYRGTVQHVAGSVATLQTPNMEAVCLEVEKQVVLLGEMLEEPVHADVVDVKLASGTVQLGNLQYVGSKLGNRMVVRVEPKEAIAVELEVGGQKIVGQLADISLDGVGVHLPFTDTELLLKLHATTQIAFVLPTAPVQLIGLVRSVRPETGGKRLGLVFSQDAQIRPIGTYITQRRAEILAELRTLYDERMKAA